MKLKILEWVGSSYKDLVGFPEGVRRIMGYALHMAQVGEKHPHATVFKGMGSANVLEIRENDKSGTYRVVYTVEIQEYVFVLHAFQKKSKTGISTPKHEIDLINSRLKEARDFYKELKARKKR